MNDILNQGVGVVPVELTDADLAKVNGGFLWLMVPAIDKVSTMLGGPSMRIDADKNNG